MRFPTFLVVLAAAALAAPITPRADATALAPNPVFPPPKAIRSHARHAPCAPLWLNGHLSATHLNALNVWLWKTPAYQFTSRRCPRLHQRGRGAQLVKRPGSTESTGDLS
jgi:hypothetical protein